MTLGEKIVSYRENLNLSQKALAERLGITPTRLNYYEKDKRNPDVEMIKLLSDALGVSGDDLLGTKWADSNSQEVRNMKFRIKEARERAGFSQTELATLIGVASNTFCGYENGKHDPKSKYLSEIAKACNTSVDYLLCIADDPAPYNRANSPAPEGAERVSTITKEQSDRLFDALVSSGIIRDDDLAPEDIQFLGHIIDVIQDWFSGKKS